MSRSSLHPPRAPAKREVPTPEAAGAMQRGSGDVGGAVWAQLATGGGVAVGDASDPLEREAERAAEAVRQGGADGKGDDGGGRRIPGLSRDPQGPILRREPRGNPGPSPAEEEALEQNLIVDDGVEGLAAGQMRRSEFLREARDAVGAAVNEVLAAEGRSTEDCPYLAAVFRYAERLETAALEREIRRSLPEASGVGSASGYLAPLVERARAGAREFVRTGQLTGIPGEWPSLSVLGLGLGALAPAIRRKSREGGGGQAGAPAGVVPGAVQTQLGAGHPLESGIAARMGTALGAEVSGVRVHTDAAAGRWADALGARAFAIGNHVAFGHNEYRPGTPSGDALMAHELAHVIQQRAAEGRGATLEPAAEAGPESALESDADRSAVGAVLSLWSRGRAALSGLGQRLGPTLRSGLRLQRCRIIEHHELGEEAMAALIERYALALTVSPNPGADGIVLVGQELSLNLADNLEGVSSPRASIYRWWVTVGDGERENPHAGYTGPVTPLEYTVREAGNLRIEAEGGVLDADANAWNFRVERRFRAVTPEARSEELLRGTTAQEFGPYMASQEVAMALLRPGDQDAAAGDFRIRTTADNPAAAGEGGAAPRMRYTVERTRGAGAVRYQWYATPMNWDGLGDSFHGFPRVTVEGSPAYFLGAGTSAEWPAVQRNLYVIRCVVRDEEGRKLDEVSYLQSVLDETGMEELRSFEEHMDRSRTMIGRLHPDQRLALPAVHVATATGAQTQLRLFLGRTRPDATDQVLLDLTPGLDPSDHTLEYHGSSTRGVMGHFDSRNKYPEGAINLRVPPNNLNFEAGRWEFETEGASLAGIWSGRFGVGALVLGILGIAAAPFTEGGSLVVTVLIVGSAAAGVTSGILSLVDRFQNAEVSGLGVALDVAGIAASFVGGAAALRVARGGAAVLVANRTTRYLLWSAFATEVVSGLLVSVEGIRQIDQIVSNPNLSPEERQRAVIRIVATLIVTGGLLAISGRQLTNARSRLRGALGAEIEAGLSDEVRLTLTSVLDDATLRSLNGASRSEVERFARVLRDDPTAAARIVASRGQLRAALATGAESAADLEFALLRLRLESGGVAGAQSGRLVTALRAAGVPGASLGQVEGDLLAALRRIDDAIASGDMTAAIREVDRLPTDFVSASGRTGFEDALATAHRRTSPSLYRHPEARLPGGEAVAPTARGGSLYYGASGSDSAPETVLRAGLPARGPNTSVEEHVRGAGDTAFRGTTTLPLTPDGSQGAARWADVGGWVYQIDGMPSWDANRLLQGRVRGPGGFGGNPVSGELEHLIPAHVPTERIRGYYPVLQGRGTSVRLGTFVPNPNYRSP